LPPAGSESEPARAAIRSSFPTNNQPLTLGARLAVRLFARLKDRNASSDI
jgi:hypothetical protein